MLMVARKPYFGMLLCMIFSMSCDSGSSVDDEEIEPDAVVQTVDEACSPGDAECEQPSVVVEEPVVVPEQSSAACPGYKAHDNFPAEYEDFCQQMVTQDLLATGDTCFFAPAPEEAGCFCKICAKKGPTVQCVSEECN